MALEDVKTKTPIFGAYTMPELSTNSCVSVGTLASMDFTRISLRNFLPNIINGQQTTLPAAPRFNMASFSSMPMNFSFLPINFNFTPLQFNFGTSYTDSFTRTTPSYLSYSNSDTEKIKIDGYNAEKGLKLSRIADKHLNDPEVRNGNLRCAQTVRENLQTAGLYNGMSGHGYQYVDILRKNSNFKEIPVENNNWQHLPAGCIVVYDKGVGGHHKKYGDVGIITEDGQQTSFYKTKSVTEIKKPTAIFVPV